MKPLLPVYFFIALYTARDAVRLSYNSFIVPIAVWTAFILFIVYKTEIAGVLTFHAQGRVISATAVLLSAFVIYVLVLARRVVE